MTQIGRNIAIDRPILEENIYLSKHLSYISWKIEYEIKSSIFPSRRQMNALFYTLFSDYNQFTNRQKFWKLISFNIFIEQQRVCMY